MIRHRILTEAFNHYALRARRKTTPKVARRGSMLRRVILDAASSLVAVALRVLFWDFDVNGNLDVDRFC